MTERHRLSGDVAVAIHKIGFAKPLVSRISFCSWKSHTMLFVALAWKLLIHPHSPCTPPWECVRQILRKNRETHPVRPELLCNSRATANSFVHRFYFRYRFHYIQWIISLFAIYCNSMHSQSLRASGLVRSSSR